MKQFLLSIAAWPYIVVTHRLFLLAIGGATGTVARYVMAQWLGELAWAKTFPLGTFVINVTGSFILGVAAVLILERLPPEYQNWYLFVGTGFCGGYTTFSTFEWETYKLIRDGSVWMAMANVVGSVVVGFLGVLVAVKLTGALLPKQ